MTVRGRKASGRFRALGGAGLLLLLPYIVGIAPNPADSLSGSSTEITLSAGRGSYADVSRDCSGNVLGVSQVPFEDADLTVKHSISVLNVGGSVGVTRIHEDRNYLGYLRSEDQTAYYVSPMVGLSSRWVGFEMGVLWFSQRQQKLEMETSPTFLLRLGPADDLWVSGSYCRNTPLLTGGGILDFGLGFNLGRPKENLWLGLGTIPFDRLGFIGKLELPLWEHFTLAPRGMFGLSEGGEFGLALGGKITL